MSSNAPRVGDAVGGRGSVPVILSLVLRGGEEVYDMVGRRFRFVAVLAFAGIGVSLSQPFQALAQQGQQAAGVWVDTDGVLRTRIYHDPSGQLTRQRMARARATLDPEVSRPSTLRKVSLNRLEAAVARRLDEAQPITDDMKYLAGLTRIRYVFFYPETKDIVIAGPSEGYGHDLSGRTIGLDSGRSVLELEDLVVALRAFGPEADGQEVISVSIDPTSEGLARMQQYVVSLRGRVSPGQSRRVAAGLRDSLGFQTVSIRGVSGKTHFAQVLVEADYRMKLIGIGLERPPVRIVSYVEKSDLSRSAANALQRWYFVPDYECVRVSDDELAMELVGDGVKLVGQDELVTGEGARVKSNRVNRASQIFVKSFTKKYPELADKSPVYAQLRNLIDMAVAAAFIQDYDYYARADWSMDVFSDEEEFSVENYDAPAQVEAAVNAISKRGRLGFPIGGGVNMQPRRALDANNLLDDEDGRVDALRKDIRVESLPKDRWWWD